MYSHKKTRGSVIALIVFLSFLFYSCISKEPSDHLQGNYSFFVAGHAYGNPMKPQYGMHPPFIKSIPMINSYPKMKFGVLTGDVVVKPTEAYWDSTMINIEKFDFPIYIAAGNHDRGGEYLKRFEKYYYSFKSNNDLFIVLSPTNWNIEGEQKEFFKSCIQNNHTEVDNIFIFCHELIWWDPNNKYGGVKINYKPHYPGKTNFYTDVLPIVDTLSNQVVFFAGDLGCVSNVSSYMYHNEKNVTLIANGMGGGKEDNIIVIEVDKNKNIDYKLIGINSEAYTELEDIEKYQLPNK